MFTLLFVTFLLLTAGGWIAAAVLWSQLSDANHRLRLAEWERDGAVRRCRKLRQRTRPRIPWRMPPPAALRDVAARRLDPVPLPELPAFPEPQRPQVQLTGEFLQPRSLYATLSSVLETPTEDVPAAVQVEVLSL